MIYFKLIYDIQILATVLTDICGLLKGNWPYSTLFDNFKKLHCYKDHKYQTWSLFSKRNRIHFQHSKIGRLKKLWISGFSHKISSFHNTSNICSWTVTAPLIRTRAPHFTTVSIAPFYRPKAACFDLLLLISTWPLYAFKGVISDLMLFPVFHHQHPS